MSNYKSTFLGIILYTSLIIGYIYGENLNYGPYYDWPLNKLVVTEFSNNLVETLINYEKYGHRHSPVYLVFLSFILDLGISIEFIRIIHLHICLSLIFVFYRCLQLKFKKVDNQYLAILSLVIFLSPSFRSLTIWPDSRIPGLIFFTTSILYFLKFLNEYKLKYAFFCTISIILSSYISPNFSVFILYFYYFFMKNMKINNLIYLLLFNFFLALPMIFYVFIMDVNFLIAGGTEQGGERVVLRYNISNKVLLISTIFLFHFLPFINSLLDISNIKKFAQKNLIIIILPLIILIYFFDYSSQSTGGGFFYQLSNFLLGNNYLFYFFCFFSIILITYVSKLDYSNLFLMLLIFLSNVQNSIYHKYYEPMFFMMFFILFRNFEFDKFFKKYSNLYILYLFSFGFIILRISKNYIVG